MNNEVASALRELYTRFGDQILNQPPRLASLLRDECPERRPEISALVKALEEHVPQDLLNSNSGEPPKSLAARLSKRLSEEHLLAQHASSWAVWAWAHGLGLGDEYRNESITEHAFSRSVVIDPFKAQRSATEPMPITAAPVPAIKRIPWPAVAAVAAVLVIGFGAAHQSGVFTPPPHIASIEVPQRIRVGRPYTFEVHFDGAKAGVVSVERRVVKSDVKWASDTSSFNVSSMQNQQQGVIEYAFDPQKEPSRTTLEFVLVDRNGKRSQPQTVSYEVLPRPVLACRACGTISGIEKITERRKARGLGAATGAVLGGLLGNIVGKGHGKTAATAAGAIGGGIAGHTIEGRMKATHWQVTVRFNGGRTQVLDVMTEPVWYVGQSVKVISGEIVAL